MNLMLSEQDVQTLIDRFEAAVPPDATGCHFFCPICNAWDKFDSAHNVENHLEVHRCYEHDGIGEWLTALYYVLHKRNLTEKIQGDVANAQK